MDLSSRRLSKNIFRIINGNQLYANIDLSDKTPGEPPFGGDSTGVLRKVSHHFMINITLYLKILQIKYNQNYNLVNILIRWPLMDKNSVFGDDCCIPM